MSEGAAGLLGLIWSLVICCQTIYSRTKVACFLLVAFGSLERLTLLYKVFLGLSMYMLSMVLHFLGLSIVFS